ncbi:MAG: twin-arginine translocase subunit TatC [Candidatus Aureabacteria bacterium]|nr:twin-arginine translocase subunit TatC [Candidatus Auribacterota bacterium]
MSAHHPAPTAPPEGGAEGKPFLDHLEELRRTLIKILLVFAAVFCACLPLTMKGFTLQFLTYPLRVAVGPEGGSIARGAMPTLSPSGGFAVAMKLSTEAAILFSLPLILFVAGGYVLPALTARERRYFVPALAAGALLFYAGIAFCYFTTLPWALGFFWRFNRALGLENLWTVNEYVAFASRLLIAFGLVFELPVVVLFLVRMGVLSYRLLSRGRRYAIVSIFILAAVMTPGPDVVSQVLMALPLLALYELCVWGARMMELKDRTSYFEHRT